MAVPLQNEPGIPMAKLLRDHVWRRTCRNH
jgi:hypothetical protein